MNFEYITEKLFSLKNDELANFNKKLTPNIKPCLGINVGVLRSIAKEIPQENIVEFLNSYAEDFHEQIMLKALVFGNFKAEFNVLISEFEKIVAKLNNWCVCDTLCMSFKQVLKHKAETFDWILNWAKSPKEFDQRVVAVLLLSYFLTDDYIDRTLCVLDNLKCSGYYTQMAVGWAVATAFAKQRDKTFTYLHSNTLSDKAYNFALKKMRESFRVNELDKEYFKEKKRKN